LKSAPFRRRVARPYFELGYSNFRMGNYERAVSYFRSCARLYPGKIRYLLYYYGSIINPRLMDALFRNVKMVYRIAEAKGRSGTKAKRVNL
jgi:outer membrane protein assembly factor BamD (BamD/ComL family)